LEVLEDFLLLAGSLPGGFSQEVLARVFVQVYAQLSLYQSGDLLEVLSQLRALSQWEFLLF